jgi:hypothetical protein
MADVGTSTRQTISIDLLPEQLARLDELRSDRNLSRSELIGELISQAKPRRVRSRRPPDQLEERVNPWAQVWPTGI